MKPKAHIGLLMWDQGPISAPARLFFFFFFLLIFLSTWQRKQRIIQKKKKQEQKKTVFLRRELVTTARLVKNFAAENRWFCWQFKKIPTFSVELLSIYKGT